MKKRIIGIFILCILVSLSLPTVHAFSGDMDSGDFGGDADASGFSGNPSQSYSSWTGSVNSDGSTSIGNWTSGGGLYSGGNAGPTTFGTTPPSGPLCQSSNGGVTGSRNTYEPCPTSCPFSGSGNSGSSFSAVISSGSSNCTTTVLPPYVPPTQPDDTPDIGTSDPTAPSVSLYIQKQGDSGWTVNTTGKASDQVSLRFVTARANYCQSTNTSYFSVADTNGVSGTVTDVQEPTEVGPTGRRTYTIECSNSSGTTVRDSVTYTIVTDPLEFTAAPKLIRSKETSKLIWNVHGRTGCTVANKANGLDSSTVSTSVGSRDTVSLYGETTYRLSCPDGSSADATIQVLPVISET